MTDWLYGSAFTWRCKVHILDGQFYTLWFQHTTVALLCCIGIMPWMEMCHCAILIRYALQMI